MARLPMTHEKMMKNNAIVDRDICGEPAEKVAVRRAAERKSHITLGRKCHAANSDKTMMTAERDNMNSLYHEFLTA